MKSTSGLLARPGGCESTATDGLDGLPLSNKVRWRAAFGWFAVCLGTSVTMSVAFLEIYFPGSHRPWSSVFAGEVIASEGLVATGVALFGIASALHFSESNPIYVGENRIWGYLPNRWGRQARRVRVDFPFSEIRYFSRWNFSGPVVCSGLGSPWRPISRFRWLLLTPVNFRAVQSQWLAWKATQPAEVPGLLEPKVAS